jgi:hypothetical protein
LAHTVRVFVPVPDTQAPIVPVAVVVPVTVNVPDVYVLVLLLAAVPLILPPSFLYVVEVTVREYVTGEI